MDEAVLEGYYKELPELELYRKQIEEIERTKAHTLLLKWKTGSDDRRYGGDIRTGIFHHQQR